MNAVVNPLTFASERIKSPGEQTVFMGRLSSLLDQYFKKFNTLENQISTIQSQIAALQAQVPVSVNLGTISTNQTVNCVNATTASFGFGQTAAFNPTITLTNLGIGVPVAFRCTNNSGASRTVSVTASNPNSVAYTVGFISALNGAEATGIVVPAGTPFYAVGMTTNTPVGIFLLFLTL